MKDRIVDLLKTKTRPDGSKHEAGREGSMRVPPPESIAEIQNHLPVFGPETEANMEQNRGIIDEEAISAFRRAHAYYVLKNFGRAINDFTRAIEVAPRVSVLYFNRAIAHERAGGIVKALGDYGRAVDIDPHYVKAYCNRASLLWSRGETQQALEDMRRAARLGVREMQAFLKAKGIEW